jgi:hypothetical protein
VLVDPPAIAVGLRVRLLTWYGVTAKTADTGLPVLPVDEATIVAEVAAVTS